MAMDRADPPTPAPTPAPAPQIRVLVLDDHQMFAESVARMLGAEHDIEVVAVAGNVADAVRLVTSTDLDIAIVDFRLPDADGAEATRRIRAARPSVRVLMLTGMADDKMLMEAIEAGCSGLVTKDKALSELVQAVRLTSAGDAYLGPNLLAGLLPRLRSGHRPVGSDLTKREREVLNLIADGLSNQAIAEQLFLSVHTVRNHIQTVLTKLDAHSKLAAAAIAAREGLLDRPR